MTAAARIARRVVRKPVEQAEPRDLIRFALFYRMDWCEQHPGLMLTALGVVILLASAMEGLLP